MGNTLSSPSVPETSGPSTRGGSSQQHKEQGDNCDTQQRGPSSVSYTVYNEVIQETRAAPKMREDLLDPRNNMPLQANQEPCPGQRELLSTHRTQSTIPKGGTDTTWLYPSPQMFYNALKRKGKGDDVEEKDMESVVAAHNTMNDITWHHVWAWEQLHRHSCPNPSLLRFLGRPDDLSPLARIRSWFGGPSPFDRHDWYVDRCGTEVRYVIDFYFDEDKAGSTDAFEIVVRPALDSPGAALDRLKMHIYRTCATFGVPCPITGTRGSQDYV